MSDISSKFATGVNPFAKKSSGLPDKLIMVVLISCASVAILATIGIVMSLIFETVRFFEQVPITDFLFGTKWSPQTAITAEVVGSSGAFGAVPLITGTLLISFIAMLIATPLGLASAAVSYTHLTLPTICSV